MQFKKTLLATLAAAALASVAFAQIDKHTNNHGAHNKAESKDSSTAADDHITAKDLKARLDKGEKIVIIDVRHDLGGQILKGAVHVPSDKLADWAKTVNKATVIATYCTCPHDEAADSGMARLRAMGFKNAYSLSGGLDAARAAGIEVVAPSDK